jgi:hypothetical protein
MAAKSSKIHSQVVDKRSESESKTHLLLPWLRIVSLVALMHFALFTMTETLFTLNFALLCADASNFHSGQDLGSRVLFISKPFPISHFTDAIQFLIMGVLLQGIGSEAVMLVITTGHKKQRQWYCCSLIRRTRQSSLVFFLLELFGLWYSLWLSNSFCRLTLPGHISCWEPHCVGRCVWCRLRNK